MIYLLDWDVEVDSKREDCSGEQDDEYGKRSILKVGDLDLHTAELDPPPDALAGWWWLETHMLPVCGLNILELIRETSRLRQI